MNCIIQCLSNIQFLTEYFIKNHFVNDLNFNNPLGTGYFIKLIGGLLASTFSELLKNLWCKNEKYFNPWELKKTIQVKAT